MPRRCSRILALTAAALVLSAGCGRDADPAGRGSDARMPLPETGEGMVEWRGSLPCADCESIDTRLVLGRSDGEDVYELVEMYVSADGGMRFQEAGHWRFDDAVLSLEPRNGGLRRYGLIHGGALQVRDLRGRELPGREGDVLLPSGHHP